MQTNIDIITALNAFYSEAFGHLVTYTSILIAFVGILIPILAQLYHNRVVRITKEELRDEIRRDLALEAEKMKKEVAEEVKKKATESDEKVERVKARLIAEINRIKGYSAIQQANYALSKGDFLNVALSTFTALDFLAQAEDEDTNLQRCLTIFTQNCAEKMSKQIWDETDVQTALKEFLDTFAKKKLDERYRDFISKIKKAEKNAKPA